MRLIDADRLLADLKEENVVPICIPNLTKKNKQIIRFENMIYEQPTAYDVDKVVEQLEEAKSMVPVNRVLDDITKDKPKELGQLIAYDKSIKIVKASGMNNNLK